MVTLLAMTCTLLENRQLSYVSAARISLAHACSVTPAGTPVHEASGMAGNAGQVRDVGPVTVGVGLGLGDTVGLGLGADVVAGGVVGAGVVVVSETVGLGVALGLGDGEGLSVGLGVGVGLLDGLGDGATLATVNEQFTVPFAPPGQPCAGYTRTFAEPAARIRSGIGSVVG